MFRLCAVCLALGLLTGSPAWADIENHAEIEEMEKAHAAWQQAEARWTGEIVQALQARAKALAQRGDSRSLLMAAYITRAAEENQKIGRAHV